MTFKYFLLSVFSFASFALSDTSKLEHENSTFEPSQRRGAFRIMEGNKIIPDNLLPTHQFTELRKI